MLSGGGTGGRAVPQTVLSLHHRPKGELSTQRLFTTREVHLQTFSWVNPQHFFSLCQGVVSGILLVTSNKIFFDPCKTHPLVKEHGCEEYLLSCSVDSLTSVSFFSDISHIHFSTSQQRSAIFHCLLSTTHTLHIA